MKNVEVPTWERKELQNLCEEILDRHKRHLNNCPLKVSTKKTVLHPRTEVKGALKLLQVFCGFRFFRTAIGKVLEDALYGKGKKTRTDKNIPEPVQKRSDTVVEGGKELPVDSNRTPEPELQDKSSSDTKLQEKPNKLGRKDVREGKA